MSSLAGTSAALPPLDHRRAGLLDWRSGRGARVAALVVAVALMSLGDLYMTLEHLRTIGLNEGNPVARYVIAYNCPWVLIAWKCACIALSSIIFLRWRTRWSSEVGVWLCFFVMAWLSIRWMQYSEELTDATSALHAISQAPGVTWVQMTTQ